MNDMGDFIIPPLAHPMEDLIYEVTIETIENIVESNVESLTLEELYQKALTLSIDYQMFGFIFNGERYHIGIIPNSDKSSEFKFKYLVARNKSASRYTTLYSLSPENLLGAINMILIQEVHVS